MSLDWSYDEVADAYTKRPGYAGRALDDCFAAAAILPGMRACDIGAGTGNLTVGLLDRGLRVVAVEPSRAMRRLGQERVRRSADAKWIAARGESTGLAAAIFDLVSFGSSFNVVRPGDAVRESARLLRRGGWLVCLWNHRELDDPLQDAIERLIRRELPTFSRGARREDPSPQIATSGLFDDFRSFEAAIVHRLPLDDWMTAWGSHLTLRRQAGERLGRILAGIRTLSAAAIDDGELSVPYVTRLWAARRL